MSDEIEVQPAPSRRVAFARWGVAQTPKIRTVGVGTFAVPAAAFVDAPEEILIGALVDGHRYVSPTEDEETGTPPPGAELLGVATEEGFAAAGGDDSGPDFAPLDDAPADDEEGQADEGDNLRTKYACPLCPRDFDTERGRDTHRRQAHRED
ncbi:hypothetical protein [Streptomyces variegatus]|uniref:hypothetical protein n=1 Tax=Streptomyces variegatus TaxID=284040 RepID=UPI003C2C54BD